VQQAYEPAVTVDRQFNAAAIAQISVPIYQGGGEYSLIRQSKETLAQQRASLEQVRDQARAYVVQTWDPIVGRKVPGPIGVRTGVGI
jgi:outer membrane protein